MAPPTTNPPPPSCSVKIYICILRYIYTRLCISLLAFYTKLRALKQENSINRLQPDFKISSTATSQKKNKEPMRAKIRNLCYLPDDDDDDDDDERDGGSANSCAQKKI